MSGLYKTDARRYVNVPLIGAGRYSSTVDYQRSCYPDPRGCVSVLPIKHTEHSTKTGLSSKPCARVGKTHSTQAMTRMLSATDLLLRAEEHSKVCADFLSVINKDKCVKKVNIYSSISSDESSGNIKDLVDTNSLRMECSGHSANSSDEIQTIEQSVDEIEVICVEREPPSDVKKEGAYAGSTGARACQMSKQDCVVKTPLIPFTEFMNDLGTNVAPHIWIGVTIEYIVPNSRLKINVNMLNTNARMKGTRLFANVCLMPGTIQKHKVHVLNALEIPLQESSVDFRGIKASDLINMDIAVRLYAKTGFFRKSEMIHEWSVAMGDMDLSDAQTAWKNIHWNM